jgi:hypothetical protein
MDGGCFRACFDGWAVRKNRVRHYRCVGERLSNQARIGGKGRTGGTSQTSSKPGWQDGNACTTCKLRRFLSGAYTDADSLLSRNLKLAECAWNKAHTATFDNLLIEE